MMTRDQFVAKAARAAEKTLGLPDGWWGTWREVRGPFGQRVSWSTSRRCWNVWKRGMLISRHDSRDFAISKARKL